MLFVRILHTLPVAKLNVLHLHLTDDQGIRIHSRSLPELTNRTTINNEFYKEVIENLF
jgi:N-acetyl-beta-hexosaminidase